MATEFDENESARKLTTREAAEYLGVRPDVVRKLVHRGQLAPTDERGLHGSRLFNVDDLAALAAARSAREYELSSLDERRRGEIRRRREQEPTTTVVVGSASDATTSTMLGAKAAAEYLGVSANQIRKFAYRCQLASTDRGAKRALLFSIAELDEFATRRPRRRAPRREPPG